MGLSGRAAGACGACSGLRCSTFSRLEGDGRVVTEAELRPPLQGGTDRGRRFPRAAARGARLALG